MKSEVSSFVAEPGKEQSRGLGEEQPQIPVAEPLQMAKATEPPKAEPQQGSVVTAKELEIRVSGKGASDPRRSPDAIQQEVETYFPEMQRVYETERGFDPSLMGSLTLDLGIAPDGRTSSVRFQSAKIPSKKFQDLILGLAHEWHFSPAAEAVQVSYPLLFLPPGMDAASIIAWEKRTAALERGKRRPEVVEHAPPVREELVQEQRYATRQAPRQQRVTTPEMIYRVIVPTFLRSEPRADAAVVTRLEPGIKVRVVGNVGDFLQVRSRKGNAPGYVPREDVAFIRGE